MTKKGIYADTIYSISKSELENHFPLYDKMEFCAIRSKLLDYAYKDFDFGYNYKIIFAKDSIFMTSNGIVINTHRKYKSYSQNQLSLNKGEIQFEILVDKITLELVNKSVIK